WLGRHCASRPELAPLVKLAQARANQRLQILVVDLLGMPALANDGPELAPAAWALLRSRANTLGGGTSEIMLTVIGERVLGLPREPDPYEGRPWSEVPRS